MENYRVKIQNILKNIIGKSDVSNVEYKTIDENTKHEDIDYRKVRGSVRLKNQENVLLPKDTELIVKNFLATKIS